MIRNLTQQFLLIFSLSLCSTFVNAQISVTQAADATDMAQTLAGPGVLISNATMSGQCPLTPQDLITGVGIGAGKFTYNGGASDIGINDGIVLTTGNADAIFASPLDFLDGYLPNGTAGDATLSTYMGGSNTNDACVLEFDLTPAGSTISFDYVFASREYPTYNCSNYNDIFAFFISGPGLPAGLNNIALVPNTTIPVTINSVNDGSNIGSACTNMGPGSPFTQYYVDNNSNQFPTF